MENKTSTASAKAQGEWRISHKGLPEDSSFRRRPVNSCQDSTRARCQQALSTPKGSPGESSDVNAVPPNSTSVFALVSTIAHPLDPPFSLLHHHKTTKHSEVIFLSAKYVNSLLYNNSSLSKSYYTAVSRD